MPANVKKWLMIAAAVVIILKFRNQLVGVFSKIPVVGPFIA